MPIIKGQQNENKISLKAKIKLSTADEIDQYCKWPGVSDVAKFIEEAAEFVLSADKDWKRYKKSNKLSCEA